MIIKITKICLVCEKEYFIYPCRVDSSKFCSYKCYWISLKNKKPWNKGKEIFSMKNEKHFAWKNKVGYRALHSWVQRNLGQPRECENCGVIKEIKTGKEFQWANKSRNYLRDLSDWIRLCVKCHRAYDRNQLTLP